MLGFHPAFSAAILLASHPGSGRQKDRPTCYKAHEEKTEDRSTKYDWDDDPHCRGPSLCVK